MLKIFEFYKKYRNNGNEYVLECFGASNTALLTAKMLNRKWIGIEINKNYCKSYKIMFLMIILKNFNLFEVKNAMGV